MSSLLLAQVTLPLPALAESCRAQLDDAERLFLAQTSSDVGEAHSIVAGLLSEGSCSGLDQRDAYILQARCEIFLQNRTQALRSFCLTLCEDPQWTPPADFFETERAIFNDAYESRPCRCGGSTAKWYWNPTSWKFWTGVALVGGLAGVGVASLGGGSDDGPATLSDFPAHP